jgi:hypothetical protein
MPIIGRTLRDVTWVEKGWNVNEKAPLGTPMGNMATNDQRLINLIYETEVMRDTAKNWLTAYGTADYREQAARGAKG